jgi:hypothetical protein
VFGVVTQMICYYYGVDNAIAFNVDEIIPSIMHNLGIT